MDVVVVGVGVVCDCQLLTLATTGYTENSVFGLIEKFGFGRPSFMGTKRFLCIIVVFTGSFMKLFGLKGGSSTMRLPEMISSGCLYRLPTMLATVIDVRFKEVVVG